MTLLPHPDSHPGAPTGTAAPDAPARPSSPVSAGRRRDLLTAGAGVLLYLVASVAGALIERYDGTLHVSWAPLLAEWRPHLGPGTVPALLVAALVVVYGPGLAVRLSWRRLIWGSWAVSMAWIWSLALVDGWQRGVADRLTTRHEYLSAVDRFQDIPATLRDFTHHILMYAPDPWPTHIAGHPPAAVLTFVGLDRIGLGGGAWASAFCVTTGATTAAAVLVTMRALNAERAARAAAPFLVLAPAAVWIGASADGYFAAVAAWALALLTLAATRTVRAPWAAALGAGLLLGLAAYLSYGLTLMAVPAVAVLLIARTARPLPLALLGFAAVTAVFLLAGFRWWEAYDLLVERYYQGVARERPYGYWVWANLSTLVVTAGLASFAGLGRAVRRLRRGGKPGEDGGTDGGADRRFVLLVGAVLLALLIADLSGMSKAETERIWLPFALWLPALAALLPARDHRGWLAAGAGTALLVNHLLLTNW